MNELVWAIVAIGLVVAPTDVVEWVADKIEERFNR